MDLQARLAQAAITGTLNVSNMSLTSLPPLPANLRELNCSFNNLTSLPPLPEGLEYLDCAFNNLQSLPLLPSTLRTLKCSINEIRQLPDLPPALEELNVSVNKLTTLPFLPSSLSKLSVERNPLTPRIQSIVDYYSSEITRILRPLQLSRAQRNRRNEAQRLALSLTKKFVEELNRVSQFNTELKPSLVAHKYDPKLIQKNIETRRFETMKKNNQEEYMKQFTMNGSLPDNLWNKYYNRRGEVWTEGVGTKKGGKRRKSKKSKTHRKRA
jgi:hypothetical protein